VPQLDGLRGIAILFVMLHHLRALVGRELGLIQPLADAGWIGVDIFFGISGFLITRILLDSRDQPHYWRNFYVRRGLRIIPLYYGVLTLIFLPRLLVSRLPAEALPSPLWFYGFLSNFWYAAKPASTDLALEVTWSLSVEEQFYLVWPLLVSRFSRRMLSVLLLGIVAAGPCFRGLLATDPQTLCHTLCRMDGLAFGCLAAIAPIDRLKRLGVFAGAAWGVLLSGVWLGWFRDHAPAIPTIAYAIIPATAVLTIASVLRTPAGALARVLAWRPLMWIGRVSFGLYLLHPLCFNIAGQVTDPLLRNGAMSNWAADSLVAGLAVTLSAVAAWVSFTLFEARILAWKDVLAPEHRRPAYAAPPNAAPQLTQ
jgi:peptidoglycan/LPS O-acetylase OafA/YrhL